jgi:hypothetical protein
MKFADLPMVGSWLREPDVARWYLAGTTLEEQIDDLRGAVAGAERTHALVVSELGRAIGWCQWYLCGDYPVHASSVGSRPGDAGIDYAIGD